VSEAAVEQRVAKQETTSAQDRRRDVFVAAACGVFVAAMLGAAYAAVPFYDWFCRVTGFNGTTQVASRAPEQVLERKINVRFDANVAPGLPWRFVPQQTAITVRLGEVFTVVYDVINETARETAGQAAYNVTPLSLGLYFQKINCFCFTEQRLKPGERREMPVVFYVDPALAQDGDADKVDTITLSYTFYPVRTQLRPVAQSTRGGDGG
jgi:cytochrome c oxidase assembly protein subunit 11